MKLRSRERARFLKRIERNIENYLVILSFQELDRRDIKQIDESINFLQDKYKQYTKRTYTPKCYR